MEAGRSGRRAFRATTTAISSVIIVAATLRLTSVRLYPYRGLLLEGSRVKRQRKAAEEVRSGRASLVTAGFAKRQVKSSCDHSFQPEVVVSFLLPKSLGPSTHCVTLLFGISDPLLFPHAMWLWLSLCGLGIQQQRLAVKTNLLSASRNMWTIPLLNNVES